MQNKIIENIKTAVNKRVAGNKMRAVDEKTTKNKKLKVNEELKVDNISKLWLRSYRITFMLLVILVLVLGFGAVPGLQVLAEVEVDEELGEALQEAIDIFDGHGSAMLFIDQESGEIIYANRAAVEFYGYQEEEFIGMNIAEINLLSPEETAREMELAAAETRNFFLFEHRLAGGETRNVEVYSYPQSYQGREILFSVVHDVTPRVELSAQNEELRQRFYLALGLVMLVLVVLLIYMIRAYFKQKKSSRRLENSKKELEKRNKEIKRINKLRQTFMDADDSLIYLKDEELKYVFVNKAVEEFYGQNKDKIIGLDDFQLTGEKFARLRRRTDRKVQEEKKLIVDEVEWDEKIYKTTKFPVELPGGGAGVGAYIKDITRDHKNREKLALERNKYLQTLISIGDGVIVVDEEGRIEIINREAEKLTGWTYLEAEGKHYSRVLKLEHMEADQKLEDPVRAALESDEVQELEDKAVLISREGERYYIDDTAAPIKDASDRTRGVVVVFRDATESKKQQEKIEYLSYHDSVTGLYNRRFFEEELDRLDTARNLPLSVIIGDLNGLKLTNDIFGHDAGDELIRQAAEVFRETCRSDDIIARWGGDEFVILLPQTNREEAERIISRIKDTFAGKEKVGLGAGISLGVSTKDEESQDIRKMLNRAETIMYSNKSVERLDGEISNIKNIRKQLEEKSSREKQHARRTAALALELGKNLGMKEAELSNLRDAACYHDIGKVGLKAEVLNKKGSLTAEQYEEIKRHPVIGYRVLTRCAETVGIAEYVLAHHEHWDGKGYPRGLKAEGIPLIARVIAVTEAYEVMTSVDSYTESFSRTEAIEELKAQAGKQFDPELVEIFVENQLKK